MIRFVLYSLFPNRCLICNSIIPEFQKFVCLKCFSNLAFSYFTFGKDNFSYEQISKFTSLEYASSLLLFHKKNATQKLIHQMKYKNKPEIGEWLAEIWFNSNKNNEKLREIECVIPVPIHAKRLKKRGYNQVEKCSKKLAHLLNCEYDDYTLKRIHHAESQTFSNREHRLSKMKNSFQKTNNKESHFLLVDDVLTTGATLSSCIEVLKQNSEQTKISVFTLGIVI